MDEIVDKIVETPNIVDKDNPIPDGSFVTMEYEEIIPITKYTNFKVRIGIVAPTQKSLLRKAIRCSWEMVKFEADKIIKERLEEKRKDLQQPQWEEY